MTEQELLKYSKEELAMFILRKNFLYDIEDGIRDVHIQYLLDKDKELTEEGVGMPLDFEKDGIKFHAERGKASAEKDGQLLWSAMDVF